MRSVWPSRIGGVQMKLTLSPRPERSARGACAPGGIGGSDSAAHDAVTELASHRQATSAKTVLALAADRPAIAVMRRPDGRLRPGVPVVPAPIVLPRARRSACHPAGRAARDLYPRRGGARDCVPPHWADRRSYPRCHRRYSSLGRATSPLDPRSGYYRSPFLEVVAQGPFRTVRQPTLTAAGTGILSTLRSSQLS